MVKDTRLYDILECRSDADQREIKKKYYQLSRRYHPDAQPADASEEQRQAAAEQFKNVSNAYQILSDERKRRLYDADPDLLDRLANASEDELDEACRSPQLFTAAAGRSSAFGPSVFGDDGFGSFFDFGPFGFAPGFGRARGTSHRSFATSFQDPLAFFNHMFSGGGGGGDDAFFSSSFSNFGNNLASSSATFSQSTSITTGPDGIRRETLTVVRDGTQTTTTRHVAPDGNVIFENQSVEVIAAAPAQQQQRVAEAIEAGSGARAERPMLPEAPLPTSREDDDDEEQEREAHRNNNAARARRSPPPVPLQEEEKRLHRHRHHQQQHHHHQQQQQQQQQSAPRHRSRDSSAPDQGSHDEAEPAEKSPSICSCCNVQ